MDISIKNLKKYISDPKSESLKLARAKDVITQNMVATEKVDGTKLTLVRTDQNDSDYTKNWIVAYKKSIMHAKEFMHLGDKEKSNISASSVGIGQYAAVFDHLKKINSKITKIPKNTEFSVEFAQNKETLTRTYANKGGMFLRSFGIVVYRVVSGELHTSVQGAETTDYEPVKRMADVLEIAAFPIFYRGNLTKAELLKSPQLAPKLTNVEWNNPLDIINKFSDAILSIPSSLGGTTEGVVLKLANGEFFKIVQADQYDVGVRDAKKELYKLDPETATEYFRYIRILIQNVFTKIGMQNEPKEDIIATANMYISNNADKLKKFFDALQKIAGGKKSLVQINDDIHETIRLLVSKNQLLGNDTKTLALIPIAGKPLHLGHWKLIEKAASANNNVVVYTSSSDRAKKGEFPIKGDDFVRFWSDIFIPHLPKNVKVKFVDSPIRSCMHELGWLEQILAQDRSNVPSVNLYSDKEDVEANFKDEDLAKYPKLLAAGKIKKVGVNRTSTVNVSGTKMREFLMHGDKDSFFKNLPPISDKEKEEIWNTILSHKSDIKKSDPFTALAADIISEIDLSLFNEGGWRGTETQKTTVAPEKVSKVMSAFEEFISSLNSFSGLPPIETNGPVGSAMYYKADLDDKTVTYGDIDIQLVLPVDTNDRQTQLKSNKIYGQKIREFIQNKKPSYVYSKLEDKKYGIDYLILDIDHEKIQVDLVISYKVNAEWSKVRSTPEHGLKGFVTGTLLSAISHALNVVIGANTNPYFNTVDGKIVSASVKKGAIPVYLKSNEVFLEILRYYGKMAGVDKVNTSALSGHYGLDKNDPSLKKKCESVVALADAFNENGIFSKKIVVTKTGQVLDSRERFVSYVLDTFINMLEQKKSDSKLNKAETPEAMNTVEKIKQHIDIGSEIAKHIIHEEIAILLTESGKSVASVDPKTPKTINGEPAQATTKLKIVDASGKDIHSTVSGDVREMVYVLNNKVHFWKKNNPYIESGFIFNGSSQYLMDPNKFGVLSKYKDSFGDIDIIIPKSKQDSLKSFLDSIDDNNAEWTPTNKNKVSKNFFYVGRTKSGRGIPDQVVTLWYYSPVKQVVQIDFECDDMTLDPQGYEKPSEWTKFTKDSPWDDLTKGIKGLAGALLLRSLARGATVLPSAVVLTPGAVKRVASGATELGPKDVTVSPQHAIVSAYTLNTGGGGTGIRKAYEFVKTLPHNGKMVNAYRFVEASDTKPEDRITSVPKIFEILFKKAPDQEELNSFRSFQGLLALMKKYLDKKSIGITMGRFSEVLAHEPLAPKEKIAIQKAIKNILGISI